MTDDRIDPWERQDTDTNPSWVAFVEYRDMGPARSLSKVATKLKKDRRLVGRWSSKHAWVIRALAYDKEVDREHRATMSTARRTAAARNVELASAMKNLAAGSLVTMGQDKKKLNPQEVARILEVATKMESLALGSPTEHVAHSGSVSSSSREHVATLSDEDRRARMRQLQMELNSRLAEDAPAEAS